VISLGIVLGCAINAAGVKEMRTPEGGKSMKPKTGRMALPFNRFCPLQHGFPRCFSLAFVPSFAEADREARLKPALFLRE
jgi:hypothetical protein